MKPLLYGYLQSFAIADAEAADTKRAMSAYAGREGFALAEIFSENVDGSLSAFAQLVEAIVCTESHHVVIPHRQHLGTTSTMRTALIGRLRAATGAQFRVLTGPEALP